LKPPPVRQPPQLAELGPCFSGIVPSLFATCSADGEPNVTYLSQVHYLDPNHVALSCQFFNKTSRNIAENPQGTVQLYDPRTFEAYRLKLRYVRSETTGPLFETMATRIQVIASHTGMAGIFRLLSADVYEVLSLERNEGFLDPIETSSLEALPSEAQVPGPLTELRGLQAVSQRIARACDLDGLLSGALEALDEVFGFAHSMVLVPDDGARSRPRLVTLASHGYGEAGIGAEVPFGSGLLGTVAECRRMVKLSAVGRDLRYGRAVRQQFESSEGGSCLAAEIPLPGLADAQAQLALPLLAGGELVGVLAVESANPLAFDEWDEAFLQIVANQIAMGIDAMQEDEDDVEPPAPPTGLDSVAGAKACELVFYPQDEVVFVDGEYLVRGVPAKILWRVLTQRLGEGRTEFSNRELRLDSFLGLPGYKDNLESRLILLRKRLEAKCPAIRMVPVRRGRFAVEVSGSLELVERTGSA
jgi:adenylate cyclase